MKKSKQINTFVPVMLSYLELYYGPGIYSNYYFAVEKSL